MTVKTPAWAYPLEPDQYDAFLASVAEELDFLRLSGGRLPNEEGMIEISPPGENDSGTQKYHAYLGNLAQTVAPIDPLEWSDVIRKHFASIINEVNQTDLREHMDISQLRVRLYPHDYLRDTEAELQKRAPDKNVKGVHRDIGGGLVEAVVIDLPSTVVLAVREQLDQFHLTDEELLAAGRQNLLNRPVEVENFEINGMPALSLNDHDDYAISYTLWLPVALGRRLPYGALVAIPARTLNLIHPITDDRWPQMIAEMIPFCQEAFASAPHAVSESIYWVYEDRFHRIGVEINEKLHRVDVKLPRKMTEILAPLSPPSFQR